MPTLLILLLIFCTSASMAGPVVIGHPGMKPLDPNTLERIYTGKVVEVNGDRVTPLNLPPGNATREAFLRLYLDQDDAKYIGYWTVRRYVGKGTPPRVLARPEDIIQYVTRTAGAIGYIDDSKLAPGLNVVNEDP